MRVAVTGADGRLGRALVAALGDAPFTGPGGPTGWSRADFDLDDAVAGASRVLDRDRPEVVVHAAAWTDVDGCARDPELALHRNGRATGVLASACAERAIDLLVVSTNEVFAGDRTDGLPYGPNDAAEPGNAYGRSKLHGEREAVAAFARPGARGTLGIARTAWLFGPPGADFPHRILAAADHAVAAGEPLRVVDDEWGNPTFAPDVADAIVELLADDAHGGSHHLINDGIATRADWAVDVLERLHIVVAIQRVPGSTWTRPSTAPRWGALAPTALPGGQPMRGWRAAMADYAPSLARERAARPPGAATATGRPR